MRDRRMAETPSGKILRFPVNRVNAGSVYCPPLKLYFPPLYRVVQTVTLEELRRDGIAEEGLAGRHIHYTLSEEDNYFGTISRTVVPRITEADQASIIIRHHPNLEQAMSYLDGAADASGEEIADPICRTKEGHFTAVRATTKSTWPGPMVIYVAIHGAENIGGFDIWQVAVGPDGQAVEGDYL